MLQLSGTLRNASVRITPVSSWQIYAQQLRAASSRASEPNSVLAQAKEKIKPSKKKSGVINTNLIASNNSMIQAAFENLRDTKEDFQSINGNSFTAIHMNTTNIESLLNIANNRNITRQDALVIVMLLLDWVKNGKVKLKVFELDSRFLHLCTLLAQPEIKTNMDPNAQKTERDFLNQQNLLYNIHGITEATKEVANLPLPHMIKIMSGLASQKTRSTPLLRALSFNISQSPRPLDIKELSDLLYSMSVLNFTDEVLLKRVCVDLMNLMNNAPKSSVIGSILRSLGSLRYKNDDVMNKFSQWVVAHAKEMRPQDLCSFFLTLAILGHTPSNVELLNEVVVNQLKESDMSKPFEWLDIVWALTILQMAQDRHIASVLDSNFVQKLLDMNDIPMPKKQKLLNINAAAQLLMKGYNGPLLESNSSVFNVALLRSKEKETYVNSVNATLENMFPSPEYCKNNIDTGMGFLLDAEACINSQGKRLPVTCTMDKTKGHRLAVVAYYYHDFCRGEHALLGFNSFYCRLLEAKGYSILSIPYTEFNPEDKTAQRITYIYDRIKSITK